MFMLCAALSLANGITITRVTQASQKPDPSVSTEPDQTRSQRGWGQPLSRVHCLSAEFRTSQLSQKHPAKSWRNSRDNLHKVYYHTVFSNYHWTWNCAETTLFFHGAPFHTQSHVNKEFDDVFDICSKLIPANINTKMTLNYSSKSHFEEVGTLSRQFIVNSHGGIKAAAFLTEMIRMVFLTTFLQPKIFFSLAISTALAQAVFIKCHDWSDCYWSLCPHSWLVEPWTSSSLIATEHCYRSQATGACPVKPQSFLLLVHTYYPLGAITANILFYSH